MAQVGHQVVLGRDRRAVLLGGARDDVSELEILDGEVDNGRVLLHEEVVLREPLRVQNQVPGQFGELEAPAAQLDVVHDHDVVELLQDLVELHLRDDVLLHGVLVQRGGWEIQPQHQKRHPLDEVFRSLLGFAGALFGGDLDLALQIVRDDGALLHLPARELEVQRVQHPRHELHRVPLLHYGELLLAARHHRLHELMRAHLSLEVARIPDLTQQLPEAVQQHRLAILVVLWAQEEVPNGEHAHQRLDEDVGVIVHLHVVQADEPGHIIDTVERARPCFVLVDVLELLVCEFRVQHVAHVVHRAVVHFVAVW
mmetsp:Transcript_2777/g.4677  ORF Transcript_2777/g.4677 Transcript_2777/m.4677 type:complete len:312 (+) Transcript_2777:303-1238(+)